MSETNLLLWYPMTWGLLEQDSLSSKLRRRFAPDARALLSHEVHMTESRVIPMKQMWIDVRGAQVPWPAERLTANCWKQRVVRVAVRLFIKMRPRSYFLCSWSWCSQWFPVCVQAALSMVSSVKIAMHLPQALFEAPPLCRAARSQSSAGLRSGFGLVNPSTFTSGSTTTNKSTRSHKGLVERITFAGLL